MYQTEKIGFKYYVKHPGMGLYQSYGNCDFLVCYYMTYQTFEQTRCSNAISSEVYWPIGFKFYVKHPGMSLYPSYGKSDLWYVIIDVSDIWTDQMFKHYFLWSLSTDWHQVLREASCFGFLPQLWKILLMVYYRHIRHLNIPYFPMF